MLRSRKDTGAFAAVVNRIFMQDFSHRITGGLGNKVNAKVASKSSSVGIPALSPIRGDACGVMRATGGVSLLDSGSCCGADECVWTERIEREIPEFLPPRRALVRRQPGLHSRRARRRGRGSLRLRLRLTRTLS